MPHRVPAAPAKGTKHAGAGRAKGTPNRISVEVKQFVAQLMNDVAYQHRLREDFRRRRVHPAVEALIWAYHLGKPKQSVDVVAKPEASARIEEERRVFALLDIDQMEELAATSQALVDRAMTLSRAHVGGPDPQPDVVESKPPDPPRTST